MDDSLKDNSQKDTNSSILKYNSELFFNDKNIYSIYKKIQNINAALFLVTNLIQDGEVLKQSLRQQALQTLSSATALIGTQNLNINALQLVQSQLLHLATLLDMASLTSLVSEMNSGVLKSEIIGLNNLLNEVAYKNKSKLFIDSAFFSDDDHAFTENKYTASLKRHEGGSIQQNHRAQASSYKGHDKRHSIKDIKKDITHYPRVPSSVQPSSESKTERRTVILNLLSKKSHLNIKDFAAVITDYSEKTIQRELLSLVEEGILKKEGERRWSTYSMA